MLAEKFTGMKPDGKCVEHWEECRTFWMVQKKKEHIDSMQGHAFQEARSCLTDVIDRWLQWAQRQFISVPLEKYPKTHILSRTVWAHERQIRNDNLQDKDTMTSKPNLKATLKTYSGKSIRRFHFWPVLHSTLYPEQITSLCLSVSAEDAW